MEKNWGWKTFLSPWGWGTSGYLVSQTLLVSTPCFRVKNHLYRRLLKLWATSVSSSQNSTVNWTSLSSFGELSRSIFMIIVIILLTLWRRTCQKPWNLSQSKPSSVGSIACFNGWKHIAQVWALQRLNNRWKNSVKQLISHTDKFQKCMTDKEVGIPAVHIFFLVSVHRITSI